jgi:hypothetical protein
VNQYLSESSREQVQNIEWLPELFGVAGHGPTFLYKAQPDRAATNGGTLEARRAGTSTAA